MQQQQRLTLPFFGSRKCCLLLSLALRPMLAVYLLEHSLSLLVKYGAIIFSTPPSPSMGFWIVYASLPIQILVVVSVRVTTALTRYCLSSFESIFCSVLQFHLYDTYLRCNCFTLLILLLLKFRARILQQPEGRPRAQCVRKGMLVFLPLWNLF